MNPPKPPGAAKGAGLLLSDDLLFTSRIIGTARDFGLTIKPARSVELVQDLAREQAPSCVLVDLAHPGLVIADLIRSLCAACSPMPRVVAYGSHVDTATLKMAREAGCDVVLPRSKFVEELPRALPTWMEPPR